jgi:ABC-type Fe3+/spermidine/putrescine transport system ATPase subunit
MVFQSYALFPHMTVFDNIAYGLRVCGIAAAETERRVRGALAMVQLDDYGRRRIEQLSVASSSASRWHGRWSSSRQCS